MKKYFVPSHLLSIIQEKLSMKEYFFYDGAGISLLDNAPCICFLNSFRNMGDFVLPWLPNFPNFYPIEHLCVGI